MNKVTAKVSLSLATTRELLGGWNPTRTLAIYVTGDPDSSQEL